MKTKKNKIVHIFILMLTLSIAALLANTSTVKAFNLDTFAYIYPGPNPVGVGQNLEVRFWLSFPPPTAAGEGGDRWQNMTVQIWKPDGTTETKGPFSSDPVGMSYFRYVPNQLGTYYFQMSFPGQILQAGPGVPNSGGLPYVGSYFKPSISPKVAVLVQQNSVPGLPTAQLPTDYWNRPIQAVNNLWSDIAGNWLQSAYLPSGSYAQYTTTPSTSHIVWANPFANTFGGIVGGELGGYGQYYQGLSYETFLTPPVIINGMIYFNQPAPPKYGSYCVNLRTGEQVWYKNDTSISLGQIYNYISPNQFGGVPYLWQISGSTYKMFDAVTGNWILSFANASSGVNMYSQTGELLVYVLNAQGSWLAMWNSSKAIPPASPTGSGSWQWRPDNYRGQTLNWLNGIEWNVTVPKIPGQGIASCIPGQGQRLINSDMFISSANFIRTATTPNTVMLTGYNLKEGQEGKVMWQMNVTYIADWSRIGFGPIADGVFTVFNRDPMVWYGYDANTGKLIWGPTQPYTNPWGEYLCGAVCAYGNLYTTACSGEMYCIDLKTGATEWIFTTPATGPDIPYGHFPFAGDIDGQILASDGKIFAVTGVHGQSQPMWPGSEIFCVNATSGKEIWSVMGWYMAGPPVAADGYVVSLNGYDNRLYCFGKGQTATTVSAPDVAIPQGTPVLMQGTITDQSPGAADSPAISDDSMSAWMEYLYMQQLKPSNATGVKVHLTAIDPNNNWQDIGTATSDTKGNYALTWTPPVPGLYKVTATFEGSNSYFKSEAGTAFVVTEVKPSAAVVTPIPSQTPSSSSSVSPTSTPVQPISPSPSEAVIPPTNAMPTTTYVAIGIAVVVVIAAAAALILRRRK